MPSYLSSGGSLRDFVRDDLAANGQGRRPLVEIDLGERFVGLYQNEDESLILCNAHRKNGSYGMGFSQFTGTTAIFSVEGSAAGGVLPNGAVGIDVQLAGAQVDVDVAGNVWCGAIEHPTPPGRSVLIIQALDERANPVGTRDELMLVHV